MKALHCIIPALIIATLIYTSCEPFEKVSEVPEIHFKSLSDLYQADTGSITFAAVDLTFSFIDGDADFGVDKSINPQDTINFVLIPFRKIDGLYDSIDTDMYGRKYTITRDEKMDREGQNKTVKGDIKLQIQYFPKPSFDTIRYDFYILDRAGNKSNTESTTDIAAE